MSRVKDQTVRTGAPNALDLLFWEGLQSGTDASVPANNTYAPRAWYWSDFAKSVLSSSDNRIVNGAMEIDQTNEGALYTQSAATLFGVDKWTILDSIATNNFTMQQSTDAPPGFKNSLLVTVVNAGFPTAAQATRLFNNIEGAFLADFNYGSASAMMAIVGFWFKSSLTGPFTCFLTNGSNSFAHQFPYLVANVWQYISFPVPGDTAHTIGAALSLGFSLGVGSNWQTSTLDVWQPVDYYEAPGSTQLVGTAGATLQISGVKFFRGNYDVGQIFRPYPQELILCRRELRKTFPPGVAVAQNAGLAGALTVRNPIAAGEPGIFWQLEPPMRATPTFTSYNPSNTNANWRNITQSTDMTAVVDTGAGTKGASGVFISTSGTVAALGDFLAIHMLANARLS